MSLEHHLLEELCSYLLEKQKEYQGKRMLIGLCGAPGSGKTTLSSRIVRKLNEKEEQAQIVPLDGFHYYKHELDEMNDPKEAYLRRGAPYTFNSKKYFQLITEIKNTPPSPSSPPIFAPSFHHEKGDPEEGGGKGGGLVIQPYHQIIISEGNYLGLEGLGGKGGGKVETISEGLEKGMGEEEWGALWEGEGEVWGEVAGLFDELWFVDCSLEEIIKRLCSRHMKAWGITREQAMHRIMTNDKFNAELIIAHKSKKITKIISTDKTK